MISVAICIFILGVICVLIAFSFDIFLAKLAFRLIVGKDKIRLDPNKLKEMFQKIMENRRQKWAFKTYIFAIISIVSGYGFFPLSYANVFISNDNWLMNLKVVAENTAPLWVILLSLLLASAAYLWFLYYPNIKYRDDILNEAAKLINEELRFVPTQDWFEEKSNLNIKNLGKSFNLNINFKYELFDDAFASTCRDDRLTQRFTTEKVKLLKEYGNAKNRLEQALGQQGIKRTDDKVGIIVDLLSQKRLDENSLITIEKAIKDIESIFRQAIQTKELRYDDYHYSDIHSALGKILEHLHNPWIQSIKGQILIVYGRGGYGKTHLLAQIVNKRLEENLPTLFFLGRLITNTSIPMDQILNTLDLKCKKETFFKALDEYGKKYGRVLLIVDGINEGIGLSLWKNHLLNFLNEIQAYKNVGLIVSVRTNGKGWFDHFISEEGFLSYEHKGFEKNVAGAVEYMFNSFSVPLPTWPFYHEYSNPLLLTLFCRAHQGDKSSLRHETRLEIIENYISHFNSRLADKFQYSDSVNVLQNILNKIANHMIDQDNRWGVSQADLMAIFHNNQFIGNKAGFFLDALVDEGILNEYKDLTREYFYMFGYDSMGAYLVASAMIDEDEIKGNLLNDLTVLDALTEVMPSKKGKELFEVLKDDNDNTLTNMFVEGLSTRNSLTEAGERFLQSIYDNRQLEKIFEIIARAPYYKDWPLNADVLDILLKPLRMVERDAVWTTNISGHTPTKEQLFTLVSWSLSASVDVVSHLDKDVLLLISRTLIWTLSTTDLSLRDKTTRALVNLLRNNDACLERCILDYYEVDDDYIVERLFAVAFGCCTINQNKSFVEKIAQLTYDCIFKEGNPRVNILVRDFAKNIIDYAICLDCKLNIEDEKYKAPYSEEKINILVPTEEIKKYELKFDNISDKDIYRAQTSIMDSMKTEYSSRGLYGDFGRYTFQAELNNWDDDIEQISNYAIKIIFEDIGYDAAVFKKFDVKYSSKSRHKNTVERIGKKYQWIAMYRTAAILANNHYGETYERSWHSPIEINVRRFDPTLYMSTDLRDYTMSLPEYKVPDYDLTNEDDERWMRSWKKMPDIRRYIEYEYNDTKWIDLYSYYSISSNSYYNKETMDGKSERELWTFIQALIVDNRERKRMCRIIHKEGLRGRTSTENREVNSIYYREYYWSDLYKKEIEEEGLTNRDFKVQRAYTDIKVQPAYLIYIIGAESDASLTESQSVIMPSPYLYNELEMRFSVNEGVWLANDGSVACFDNYWVHGKHSGLLIRKDLLLDYLKRNKKSIVWPVLMERTCKPSNVYWPRIQVGGYVWMDMNGRFHYKFRDYEENWKDKVRTKVHACTDKQIHCIKKSLRKRGLLKKEMLDLASEFDEEEK